MAYAKLMKREELMKKQYVSVREAAYITGIGISAVSKMANDSEADFVIHVGQNRGRRLIDREMFIDYLKRKG